MRLAEKDSKFILEYIEYAYYNSVERCVGDIEIKECEDERDRALKIVNDLMKYTEIKNN